jgi:hypothetical protein
MKKNLKSKILWHCPLTYLLRGKKITQTALPDLLDLDLGVLVADREATLGARHPPNSLRHNKQDSLILKSTDLLMATI